MQMSHSFRVLQWGLPALAAGAFFLPALARAAMPDGPGKDTMVNACSQCHEPERAAALRQDRDHWEATIDGMIAQGAQVDDDQFKAILEYLSKAFPPVPPKSINLNTATAADMEKALGLVPAESAAIIQYREANGKFTSIDDLKKVSGVAFSKIEAQKDHISF